MRFKRDHGIMDPELPFVTSINMFRIPELVRYLGNWRVGSVGENGGRTYYKSVCTYVRTLDSLCASTSHCTQTVQVA